MPQLIVKQARAASIQGLGRYGGQRYGIAPGGAMDRFALAEVNALVGQPAGAAAIEIGPWPASFVVSGGTIRLAVTGAERQVLVDDRAVERGVTVCAVEGSTITIRGAERGQYSYLAFQGGLQGAAEANTPSQAGAAGFYDHARSWVLCAGNVIALRTALPDQPEKRLRLLGRSTAPVRVVLGPQLEYFSTEALWRFLATTWSVSHASNRMAYLLEGGRVELEKGHNIVSDGTVTGNIQIAGSGQPYVILCDRGTIGGYPKIATIISADLGHFVQTPLSGQLRFEPVSVLEAQTAARDFAVRVSNVKPKLEIVRHQEITAEDLYDTNLGGDVVDAAEWAAGGTGADPDQRGQANR
jgi:5-oxoprolinase (ATP-hydrolysing) subunit C